MKEVRYIIEKNPEAFDTDKVIFQMAGQHRGAGFVLKDGDGPVALTICPVCEKENNTFDVLSGHCAWCGFNTKDAEEIMIHDTDRRLP